MKGIIGKMPALKIFVFCLIAVLGIAAIVMYKQGVLPVGKQEEGVKEFNVKAFQFGYTPDTIKVKKGDIVRIVIDNADVLHGIRIPDLGIKGNDKLEFTAGKAGEFIWYCTNMCGEGHRAMQGRLIVE